jgi:hypothetical protein
MIEDQAAPTLAKRLLLRAALALPLLLAAFADEPLASVASLTLGVAAALVALAMIETTAARSAATERAALAGLCAALVCVGVAVGWKTHRRFARRLADGDSPEAAAAYVSHDPERELRRALGLALVVLPVGAAVHARLAAQGLRARTGRAAATGALTGALCCLIGGLASKLRLDAESAITILLALPAGSIGCVLALAGLDAVERRLVGAATVDPPPAGC